MNRKELLEYAENKMQMYENMEKIICPCCANDMELAALDIWLCPACQAHYKGDKHGEVQRVPSRWERFASMQGRKPF